MKLFLSHASEDKAFVRQLHDRLVAEGYNVWLDEKEMTLGDSLLVKINGGLATCDYGVVVLSSTYFGKKWTTAELGGLMALESKTKKMILPVWKDISAEEVTKLIPTMADRLAINASQGLDAVVQAIKYTVSGAEQQRKQSRLEQVKGRLEKMNAGTKARVAADTLLNSPEGVRRARVEANRFFTLLNGIFTALTTDDLKFTVKEDFPDHHQVQGPKGCGIAINFVEGASNVAAYAELHCVFFQLGRLKPLHGGREDARRLTTLKFFPYFDARGTAVWTPTEKREETMSTEDLVALLAEKLADYVEKAK